MRAVEDGLSGERLSAVNDAAAGIWAELHGTGPREVKAYVNDDMLFVVMRGAMTRQERTLAERGRGDLVREARMVFEETIRDDLLAAIESATARKVLDYHSQVLLRAEVTVEAFLLESP